MTHHAITHPSKPNNPPFLLTAHKLAWRDIKIRWKRGLFAVFCLVSITGLCSALYLCFTVPRTSSRLTSACRPDASFSLDASGYDYWAASGFFQVTLGFGELMFTAAKAIDVVWDVVVGRGGQAILATVSWRVFGKYVASSMHGAPVTLNTFRTVFVHGDLANSMDLLRLVRDFVQRRRLRSIAAMVFMIASMSYILAFPTLGSAMTGYSANLQAFVEDGDRNYVPFTSFRHLFYVLHDGERVGLTKDFEVAAFDDGEEPLDAPERWLDRCGSDKRSEKDAEQCRLISKVTGYVLAYGLNESRAVTSYFISSSANPLVILKPPTLNITAYYIPESYLSSEYSWKENESPNVTDWISRLSDSSHKTLSSGSNTAWPLENVEAAGLCQPLKTYNWGFSLLQLILNILLLLLWSIGVSAMYVRSHIAMRKRGNGYVPRDDTAVCELADAIRKQEGVEEEGLRNREVKGGSISLKESLLADKENEEARGEWKFRLWLDGEKWWFVLLAIGITGMGYYVGTTRFDVVFALVAPFCVVLAVVVGRGRGSRCVLLLWSLVLFGAVPSAIVAVVKRTL